MEIIDLTKRSSTEPSAGKGQFCMINTAAAKSGGSGALNTAAVDFTASFSLPMPTNLRRDYSADWNIDSTGLIERTISDAVARVGGKIQNGEFVSDASKPTNNVKANAVNELIKIAQGTSFRQAARDRGLAFNPHKELFYAGPGFRAHPLEFKFKFEKESDAASLDRMVTLLAASMSPEYLNGAASGVWRIPDTFYVQYVNAKVPKIPPTILTSLQTNLTEAGVWKAFKDGRPAFVSLSLTFLELAPLTKGDIMNKGY